MAIIGVSKGTSDALEKLGVQDLSELEGFTLQELEELDGIGKKRAEEISLAIKESKQFEITAIAPAEIEEVAVELSQEKSLSLEEIGVNCRFTIPNLSPSINPTHKEGDVYLKLPGGYPSAKNERTGTTIAGKTLSSLRGVLV